MQYRVGDVLVGKITGIQNYGIFVKLDKKTQGLVHISEIDNKFVNDIFEEFEIDQNVRVMILNIDEYTNTISLSMRILRKSVFNVGEERNEKHKRMWTNYHLHIGFTTIEENYDRQLKQARIDFL